MSRRARCRVGHHRVRQREQVAELAPAFVFLASQESSFVNGETLVVTGGQLLP